MRRIGTRIQRTTLWVFLLVMPVGIRIDGDTDAELTLEGHAGAGQVYSVLRDCSGAKVASQRSTFTDIAVGFAYGRRFGEGNFIVLGLRGGHLSAKYRRATRNPSNLAPVDIDHPYWNPYLALERPYIGWGVGYLSGAPGPEFGSHEDQMPVSGHLRVGNYAATHFLASLNENLPLASGGGYLCLGVGYAAGPRASLFSGLSKSPFDGLGFVQKVSFQLDNGYDLDLNGRAGLTEGSFEGSFSLGLRYHRPLGPETGGNLFLEKHRRKKPEQKAGYREVG